METGIGTTLREARNRRKVDLSEAEAAIKIRARYLRAMENEEWDVLPGGAYTRAFVRTYANYLGLDGERLAEEYQSRAGPAVGERAVPRVEPVASPDRRRRRVPGRAWTAVVLLAVVALLVGIGLAGGGDDGESTDRTRESESGERSSNSKVTPQPGVSVELTATAEVWVCLLDAAGEPLINGLILEAGEGAGPFRAEGFSAAFGNGEFELTIDGAPADTPPSSSPVGYEIDSRGDLTPLGEGERPDCA